MVGADAEVDHVGFLDSEAVVLGVVVDQLSHTMGLADCDDGGLRAQDGRHEVASTNVTDARDTKGAIVKVSLREATICSLHRKVLKFRVDLQDALILDLLDVGHGEAVWAVDCNTEVVIVLDNVALDVALGVKVVIDVRVHDGVLRHGD